MFISKQRWVHEDNFDNSKVQNATQQQHGGRVEVV